jgi:hypothetical protein
VEDGETVNLSNLEKTSIKYIKKFFFLMLKQHCAENIFHFWKNLRKQVRALADD